MTDPMATISSVERAIVEAEEALLARAAAAIERARDRAAQNSGGDLRSVEALRLLREEAKTASEDDLPGLLHEMAVRQQLLEKSAPSLPDLATPYLAHLRIREGEIAKDYLLGHVSLLDTASDVRIVDFRLAPVAQLFYRYREGDEYEEEFPGRTAEGTVEVRRIVVIEGGHLRRILGDRLVLTRETDGRWASSERATLALAEGGTGTATRPGSLGVGAGFGDRVRTKDVTALLDQEQFAAISAPPEEPLVVLGSAGSGKTTVALHRVAWVAARHPEKYPLERARVLVPEEGLARLSRRLLLPLGVGRDAVLTLDVWSIETAKRVFRTKLPRLSSETPGVVVNLKRHPALFSALRGRFSKLSSEAITLRRLRKRLATLLSDSTFLRDVVDASNGTLPRSAVHETVRHTMLQLAAPMDLAAITDRARKRAIDDQPVAAGTPDELAGTMDLEDVPILLFLKALRGDLDAPDEAICQLVLDEAEDFSPFELFVLGKLLREDAPSVTLAGDEAQQTSSCFAGWPAAIATLGVNGASVVRLAVSYRCPRPVTELAQAILGPLARAALGSGAPEPAVVAARDGAPVGKFRFADVSHAHLFVTGAAADLGDREPEASIAIVARDADAARALFPLLSHRPDARLVLEGDFTFEPGIDVTHVDAVKGLEFDYVVVPDASRAAYPETDEARRRLHVAVTRAAHQLWLVSGGEPTGLVPF
jgi:DNA helicase-2/ATP-dependent DNA helicase PcrA